MSWPLKKSWKLRWRSARNIAEVRIEDEPFCRAGPGAAAESLAAFNVSFKRVLYDGRSTISGAFPVARSACGDNLVESFSM